MESRNYGFINVPPYHELFDEYGNPTDKNPAKRLRDQNEAFLRQTGFYRPQQEYRSGYYPYLNNRTPQQNEVQMMQQHPPQPSQQNNQVPPYPYQANSLFEGIEENGYVKNTNPVFFGQNQNRPQTPREYKRGFIDPRKVITRIDMKERSTIKAEYQAARTYAELVLEKIGSGSSTSSAPMDIWADDFIVDVKLYDRTSIHGKEVDEVTTIYNMLGGHEPIYKIDRNHVSYPIYHTEDNAFRDESLVKVLDIHQYEGIVIEKSIRFPLRMVIDVYDKLNTVKNTNKLKLLYGIRDKLVEYRDMSNQHHNSNIMVELSLYYCYSVEALNRGNRYLYLPETDICLYVGKPDKDIVHPTDNFDLKYMFQVEKEVGYNVVIDIIDNRNKISDYRYVYVFGKVKEIPVRRNVPGIKDGIYLIETRNKRDMVVDYYPLESAEELGIYRTEEEAQTNGNPELMKSLELQKLKERLERTRIEYEGKIKDLKIKEKEILNQLSSEGGKEKLELQRQLNALEKDKAKMEHDFRKEKHALEQERLRMEAKLKKREQELKEQEHKIREEKLKMEAELREKEQKFKEEQHEWEKDLEKERQKREKLSATNNTLKIVAGILTVAVSILTIYRSATAL